jgi:cell division protein FtsW
MKVFSAPKIDLFKRTKGIDWWLVAIIFSLVMIGLTFLSSALVIRQESFWKEFLSQLIYGVWIGGVGAILMTQIDYHKIFDYKWWLIGCTSIMLIFLAGFAVSMQVLGISGISEQTAFLSQFSGLPIHPYAANGAARWIKVIGLPTFQPSELAKLTMLIFMAGMLQKYENEDLTWMKLKLPLYIFFALSTLILVQPDLGSVLLIFVMLLSAMWVSRVPTSILTTISAIVITVALFLTFGVSYRRNRLDTFVSGGNGKDHVSLAKNAITYGGLTGKGYGKSISKQTSERVPELSTDSIISLIAEEMGFVFVIAFISLYLLFFFRGLKIAQEAPDMGGRALATGLSVWVCSQAFFNIMSMTGLVPTKGIPLPLVSEGGSAMILNLIAAGILLNISRQKAVTGREIKKSHASNRQSLRARNKSFDRG